MTENRTTPLLRCDQCGNPPLVSKAQAGDFCQYDTCFGHLFEPEALEADYATAADAKFDHEITMLMIRMRSEVARLASEWRKAREEELAND